MYRRTTPFIILLAAAVALPAAAAPPAVPGIGRDGKIYDQWYRKEARAEKAAIELDSIAWILGQWDVAIRAPGTEGEENVGSGIAEITYMNRGHAFFERFHSDDFNGAGRRRDTIVFLVYNPNAKTWNLGEADSWTESAAVYHGTFDGNTLTVRHPVRRGGGLALTEVRIIWRKLKEKRFEVVREESIDDGATWTRMLTKTYTKRKPADDFLAAASDWGTPDPARPAEAGEFDFLVGGWASHHEMTFPDGRTARWSATDRAIHVLNGQAVMEHSWFDADPTLPDAATTIVRIYNRAARRWECLYTTNRNNSILYFGGVREKDRIVLHLFDVDMTNASVPYFIFHDIAADRYLWHAESTTDRGATWKTNWKIEVVRDEVPADKKTAD